MSELPKTYNAHEIERKWFAWWQERGLFHREARDGGTPYCIVIPPPNVTGILHMGHALNNSIQDVLIRWKRMEGFNAVWVPGTDHAGIATQNVVERELKKEGKTRDDLGRDAFVQRVWKWREKYGATIINQLKRLGASCDWARERFTMDEGLSNAVAEVFIRLYEKGLIYRGKYIINWCPRCRTALADEESEHEDLGGKLYYIRYPLEHDGGRYVVVATTRPETLLGDVAVAINPRDARYRWLVGKTLRLPILNRRLVVIEDDFVDPAFGTGVVKVTPAHDPNDFQMGLRHHLTPIDVMNDDGSMNEEAGPYAGMDRFACRENIVEDLKEAGLIEKIEDHDHAVGHCYRCHTMVEPRLSSQWFVKMRPLAEPAIQAVKEGRIRFIPDRWTKVYLEWMENIRDWCISRQIWWGHRIPVYYCDACGHQWASRGRPAQCPKCGAGRLRQDEDVLDTWFSSWLWPFSVFGWPNENEDLKFYYPTHTLVTASEIIFFWVARMIMAGMEFMQEIPFREVYIHGTVRDDTGVKMSKSLGNAIDPLEIIEKYSADALRFSLIMLTATGQDVYISHEKFEIGRNFGTKIWNAARFLQMQSAGDQSARRSGGTPDFARGPWRADDLHILAKLSETAALCAENLEKYRFNDYAKCLYDFIWHQFCDWYVEYAKVVLRGNDEARKKAVLDMMHYVFAKSLCLLHPLMPFLTEELWHGMGYGGSDDSIMTAEWPRPFTREQLAEWGAVQDVVAYVDARQELIRIGRTLRADYNIAPGRPLEYIIKPASADALNRLKADEETTARLLNASRLGLDAEFVQKRPMPHGFNAIGTIYLSLEGVLDTDAEIRKLQHELDEVDRLLESVESKLKNENFLKRAPEQVVQQHRTRRDELAEKRAKLQHAVEMLSKV
jgi:valyl-tRNA synthetase